VYCATSSPLQPLLHVVVEAPNHGHSLVTSAFFSIHANTAAFSAALWIETRSPPCETQ